MCDQYLQVYRESFMTNWKTWRKRRPSSVWPGVIHHIVDRLNARRSFFISIVEIYTKSCSRKASLNLTSLHMNVTKEHSKRGRSIQKLELIIIIIQPKANDCRYFANKRWIELNWIDKVLFFSYNLFISWHIYFIYNVASVKTFTLICHTVTFKW